VSDHVVAFKLKRSPDPLVAIWRPTKGRGGEKRGREEGKELERNGGRRGKGTRTPLTHVWLRGCKINILKILIDDRPTSTVQRLKFNVSVTASQGHEVQKHIARQSSGQSELCTLSSAQPLVSCYVLNLCPLINFSQNITRIEPSLVRTCIRSAMPWNVSVSENCICASVLHYVCTHALCYFCVNLFMNEKLLWTSIECFFIYILWKENTSVTLQSPFRHTYKYCCIQQLQMFSHKDPKY